MDSLEESKRCKGVKKSVVKKNITFENYKNVLFYRTSQMAKMNVIRSHKHEVNTEEVNKVALNGEDDKRVVLQDRIQTLAYGHYSLRQK